MTTQPTDPATVTRYLDEARLATVGHQILGQARCVDWLLDCLNAARRPGVRDAICGALAAIADARALTATDFRKSLDDIQLAVEVDTAFDHLDLSHR